jgi:hypothetical protein
MMQMGVPATLDSMLVGGRVGGPGQRIRIQGGVAPKAGVPLVTGSFTPKNWPLP